MSLSSVQFLRTVRFSRLEGAAWEFVAQATLKESKRAQSFDVNLFTSCRHSCLEEGVFFIPLSPGVR